VRTSWPPGPDLWLRRSFEWKPSDGPLRLFVNHDDSMEIWINGEPAATGPTWSGGRYREYPIARSGRRALKPGTNVIAAKVHDIGGGRSFDARFDVPEDVLLLSAHWTRSAPGPDVPFVRRWQMAGPFGDEDHQLLLRREVPETDDSAEVLGKRWREQRSLTSRFDPGAALGAEPGDVCAVATWFHADAALEGYLWLGASGGARAWLDGGPLALHHEHRFAEPDRLRVPFAVKPGAHRLVLLVESGEEDASLYVRAAAKDGAPLAGLRWSLDAKDGDRVAAGVAQPAGRTPAELFDVLPSLPSSAWPLVRREHIERLAVWPGAEEWPRWVERVGRKDPDPAPPTGGRGMLVVRPPLNGEPVWVAVRLELPPGTREVGVRLALGAEPEVGARVRVSLWGGGATHPLVERELSQPGSPGKGRWDDLVGDPGPLAGGEALLLVELAVLAGLPPALLYLDQIQVR
jgi:hypothetical protein